MPTVGYSSPFVPPEWIAAYGGGPRRVVPAPGAAARSPMPVMGVCPFARAFVGEACVDRSVDAVVFATTCDQMRRAAEFVTRARDLHVFLMNVPATWRTPGAFRLYMDELRRLGRFLADLGGRAPSDGDLADAMDAFDARRAELRGALGRLAGRGRAEALAAFHAGDPVRPAAVGDPGRATGRAPLVIVGGPLMRGAAWLFDAVERAGGRVVLDGTEGGERTLPAPFDRRRLRDEPMTVLAESYFGRIPDAFRRPDSMLYEWAAREAAAGGARGVILLRYAWCDMWALARERLAGATGLPVLDLDLAGDADAESRAANRIGAFVEALP